MTFFKKYIAKIPVIGGIYKLLHKLVFRQNDFRSKDYWDNRYQDGANSGAGSYGRLAEFKAEFLNDFVKKNKIDRVIEFGSGDGNQASLFDFPGYVGLDVSQKSIEMCIDMYEDDKNKSFFIYNQNAFLDNIGVMTADLTLSLDVIYHLVEDEVFETYLKNIFGASNQYVIIYSSNKDSQNEFQSQHVRHRKFTDWIEKNISEWELAEVVKNKFPHEDNEIDQSFADFYIYQKVK